MLIRKKRAKINEISNRQSTLDRFHRHEVFKSTKRSSYDSNLKKLSFQMPLRRPLQTRLFVARYQLFYKVFSMKISRKNSEIATFNINSNFPSNQLNSSHSTNFSEWNCFNVIPLVQWHHDNTVSYENLHFFSCFISRRIMQFPHFTRNLINHEKTILMTSSIDNVHRG